MNRRIRFIKITLSILVLFSINQIEAINFIPSFVKKHKTSIFVGSTVITGFVAAVYLNPESCNKAGKIIYNSISPITIKTINYFGKKTASIGINKSVNNSAGYVKKQTKKHPYIGISTTLVGITAGLIYKIYCVDK